MPVPGIFGALSLIGTPLAGNSANRNARRATNTARRAEERALRFLPENGFSVSAGGVGGPSFTFGGQNGRLTGNSNNPFGSTLGTGTQGQVNQPGVFRDPATGVIFDGLTGQPVTNIGPDGQPIQGGNQFVGPGDSFLNIDVPEFSANTGRLHGLTGELTDLASQFNETGNLTSEQLLGISAQAGELLPRVALGAGETRSARLGQLDNQQSSSRSDLRDSIARRRISGSSFAADALTRQDAEFAQRRAEADALSTVEEITVTSQILGFQSQVINQAGQTMLAALQGELGSLAQASNNELGAASLELQADQATFQAQATALALAFQGQELAQDYITRLLAIANGATEAVQDGLTNQASLQAGFANAGLAAAGSAVTAAAGAG